MPIFNELTLIKIGMRAGPPSFHRCMCTQFNLNVTRRISTKHEIDLVCPHNEI